MGACSSNKSQKRLFYEEKILTEPHITTIEELDQVRFQINGVLIS